MKPRRVRGPGQRGPLELLEDAVELCAQDPAACLQQVAGNLGFSALLAWGILYCQRSQQALQDAGLVGLGLALAHMGLKLAQNRFGLGLAQRLGLQGQAEQRAGRWRNQLFWQPWSVILIPLAGLALYPLAHVSAFFHNLAIIDDGHSGAFALGKRAWALARRASFQLHMAHQILLGLVLLAWLNLGVLVFGAASLAHEFFGLQSNLVLDPGGSFNSTLLLLLLGAAWALLQPLAKAVHALRASEAEALTEGQDLLLRLKALGPLQA